MTERAWREDRVAPNARRVVETHDGCLLVGDMTHVVSALGTPTTPRLGNASNEFLENIRGSFEPCQLALWRGRLLNTIGCPGPLASTGAYLDEWCRCEEDRHVIRGDALFHLGRYREAGRTFLAAAAATDDAETRLSLTLRASDAYRSFGRMLRSYRLAKHVSLDAPKLGLESKQAAYAGFASMKMALLLRDLHRVAEAIRVKPLVAFAKSRAAPHLRDAAAAALNEGNWFEFQQTSLWAERMGIDPSDMAAGDSFPPPPSIEGYRHLGYWIAQSMAFRDGLRQRGQRITDSQFEELQSHLETALKVESYPELWKLARHGLRSGALRNRGRCLRLFVRGFLRCQYAVWRRIAHLVAPG